MKKLLIKTFALGAILLLAQSCSTSRPMYSWYGYDDAAYEYSRSHSPEQAEKLAQVYKKIIKSQKGSRGQIPPGMCAEYGYLLIKQGKREEGLALLNKEIELYPESQVFISRIIKQFKK